MNNMMADNQEGGFNLSNDINEQLQQDSSSEISQILNAG